MRRCQPWVRKPIQSYSVLVRWNLSCERPGQRAFICLAPLHVESQPRIVTGISFWFAEMTYHVIGVDNPAA